MADYISKVVLFDFDGIISDVANIHVAAWERTFAAMGWEIPPEICARSAYQDDVSFLTQVFATRSPQSGDIEGWLLRKQAMTRAMISFAPRIYPGIPDLFQELINRGIRLGIVTGTWRENVEAALESAGLAASISTCITKEDITSMKPDPQGYLLACKKLEVDPKMSIALEDSPSGLEAATLAGTGAVAVGHRSTKDQWKEGTRFLVNLRNTHGVLTYLGLF